MFLSISQNIWNIPIINYPKTTIFSPKHGKLSSMIPSVIFIKNTIAVIFLAALVWILVRYLSRKRTDQNDQLQTKKKQGKKQLPVPAASGIGDQPFSATPHIATFKTNHTDYQDNIDTSCQLLLETILHAMNLSSVVLLQGNPPNKKVFLRAIATVKENVNTDTESRDSGIFNILLQGKESVNVCPVSQQVANIPYYQENIGVGSLFALRISPHDKDDTDQPLPFWILSVDRSGSTPWTDSEKKLLHMAAQKLNKELQIGDRLIKTVRNSNIISKLYEGLQGLNSVLDLKETFNIAVKYVKELVEADLVTISLLHNKEHTITRADGFQADGLEGCKFKITDGLVGKAIQCNHWMPPTASYPDPAPIFSRDKPMSGFKSLLIVPLCQSSQEAMGALTIASRKPGIFGQEQRNIMELIAGQIAIKIELAQAHEKIYQMALTDGLTGLNNHRTFQLGLDNMLTRARRQTSSLCLILCDIDHFKKINDTHGHPFGDQVLKKVATTLKQSIRQVDLTARYGGEEFALILEASDEEGGLIQAERVRKSIEDLIFDSKGEKITITMSFGLASYPLDGDSKAELIDRADQALYAAKESGRNRSIAWSDLH